MPPNLSVSEQLAYTTVRIECDTPEGMSTGTGFYFGFCETENNNIPAIVTNRHVVAGSTSGRFHIHLSGNLDTGPTSHIRFEVPEFEKHWIGHPDPNVDLCVMPIASLMRNSEKQGKKLFFIKLGQEELPSAGELANLMAVEDVVMVGYPNGIWDHVNNMPIFRRGTTATHPNADYCGRKEFMIDAACFPGSSGSPVLLYNLGSYVDKNGTTNMGSSRIKLLGVLYAGPQHTATGEIVIQNLPTVAKPISISRIPNNLGLIIKAERLRDFEAVLRTLAN